MKNHICCPSDRINLTKKFFFVKSNVIYYRFDKVLCLQWINSKVVNIVPTFVLLVLGKTL